MRAAYDEVLTTAVKRQHEPQQIIGDLLTAEIREKQARSVKYQMTIAKLPLAKELEEFDFEAAEVNETLIRDLATGDFLDHQRNLVLIGGTGTGKTHLAVCIARTCIRAGRRGRFFNVVDLVNKLDAEARAERQGRTADLISRLDFLILDELGYLPFAQTGGQLLFQSIGPVDDFRHVGGQRTDQLVLVAQVFWFGTHRDRCLCGSADGPQMLPGPLHRFELFFQGDFRLHEGFVDKVQSLVCQPFLAGSQPFNFPRNC